MKSVFVYIGREQSCHCSLEPYQSVIRHEPTFFDCFHDEVQP